MKDLDISIVENEHVRLELYLRLDKEKEYYYRVYDSKTNESVAVCGLRLEKNEKNYYLGNVEYSVKPKFRGYNYAYKACKLLMKVALSLGADDLIITANPNNKPSLRIIEKLGARFIRVVNVPSDHVLYKQGERFVKLYEWNLKRKEEDNYDRHKIN